MTLARGQFCPEQRLEPVLLHALSVEIEVAHAVLRALIAALGGDAAPARSFRRIYLKPLTMGVHHREIVLGGERAVIGSAEQPFRRRRQIARPAAAAEVVVEAERR